MQSYVGMSYDELWKTWSARYAGEPNLEEIHRRWRRMGKLITQNRRTEGRKRRG